MPPKPYEGKRSEHSDTKWLALTSGTMHRALVPYAALVAEVEARPKRDRHDLRSAAISAIAADWFAASPPGSTDGVVFAGDPIGLGFVLPPRVHCDSEFLAMLDAHRATFRGDALTWI